MSRSLRWLLALGLVGLLVGSPAHGQKRTVTTTNTNTFSVAASGFPASPFANANINPNFRLPNGLTISQAAFNTATIGRALAQVPPYAYGFNPYTSSAYSPAAGPALSPYGLSTSAGYNPYLGGAASIGASPYGNGYSLSTGGSGSSYNPYGGYGYGIPPEGAALQGLASLTDATGKYWMNIQKGRLLREEESRRSAIDTARKQIEFEMWWDKVRPTAPKMREQEKATDLDRARKDPPMTEIWSAKSLNDLLRSIKSAGKFNRGPNLELPEDTLKHINLTDSSSSGNIGMLKDGGKVAWPMSLQEPVFDKERKQLTRNLPRAVDQLKDKEPVDRALLKDINSDFKALNDTLNASADELSPAQYIEAKRYLNQLKSAIKALSDPRAAKYFDTSWNAKGRNVAELVDHMSKEGLVFAPAAPGEEGAYTALYQALRAFEAGVQTASR